MLEISAVDLKSAMNTLLPVLKKNTIPILGHVLVKKEGERITLTANNLHACISLNLSAQGEDLTCTIPGDKLAALARRVNKDMPVKIKIDHERSVLSAGRGRFEFIAMPVEDFPLPPEHEATLTAHVPAGEFHAALDRTSTAMADNDPRIYLNGVNLEVEPDGITLVATNGHRVFVDHVPVTGLEGEAATGILPPQGVSAAIKLLAGTDDESVELQLGPQSLRIATPAGILVSQLVDAKYPDWHHVVQQPSETPVMVDREEFLNAIETAVIAQSDMAYRAIEVNVDDVIRIEARNLEASASGHEELDCIYTGETAMFAVNAAYLTDALKSAEGEHVQLSFHGGDQPIRVSGERETFSATIAQLKI